jgi:hypothetical protein
VSPFTEVPENDVTPPSEQEEPIKVVWSNDKWKMVARNQGLNDLENELDLLAWIQDGPVDRVYNLGFRHSSTRFQVAKTKIVSGSTDGQNELTILTAQSTFTPAPPDMLYSPIMEVDEFDLEGYPGQLEIRRTTIGPTRVSTSTEYSTASAGERTGSTASSGSYFPANSARSSSNRVRASRSSKRSMGERAEAYTAQMNDATATCWDWVANVDWSKTQLGPRSGWNDLYDGLLSIVFQSPSQDSIWLGEDLQILQCVPPQTTCADH